ncbi:MAG: unnamed protein product [uncultured Paraburkholderia sp.]|nr:MAG: unnamed protein product [uncultured Paraburkholderia sp.]
MPTKADLLTVDVGKHLLGSLKPLVEEDRHRDGFVAQRRALGDRVLDAATTMLAIIDEQRGIHRDVQQADASRRAGNGYGLERHFGRNARGDRRQNVVVRVLRDIHANILGTPFVQHALRAQVCRHRFLVVEREELHERTIGHLRGVVRAAGLHAGDGRERVGKFASFRDELVAHGVDASGTLRVADALGLCGIQFGLRAILVTHARIGHQRDFQVLERPAGHLFGYGLVAEPVRVEHALHRVDGVGVVLVGEILLQDLRVALALREIPVVGDCSEACVAGGCNRPDD